MRRLVPWLACLCLSGCLSEKARQTTAREPLLPRADFILQNDKAFFAKPDGTNGLREVTSDASAK